MSLSDNTLFQCKGEKNSCVDYNMPGKSGLLKCTFMIRQLRICVHNGNRKLKLAIVSAANLVLFNFLLPIASFYFVI